MKAFLYVLFSCLTFSAIAQQKEQANNTVILENTQKVSFQDNPITSKKTDAEILQSLDGAYNSFNNEPLTLKNDGALLKDKKVQSKSLSSSKRNLTTTKVNKKISEQQIINNSFSDLDIEFILRDKNDYRSTRQNRKQKNIVDHVVETKNSQSVGVKGTEEAIINKLDKSDLMDFNKNTDIWSKEVSNQIDVGVSEVDIDELTEDHIELDDNQLIDEINGID